MSIDCTKKDKNILCRFHQYLISKVYLKRKEKKTSQGFVYKIHDRIYFFNEKNNIHFHA